MAFPTETVYGLGANGMDGEAVKKIYTAKGRPSDNPLILHIANEGSLEQLALHIPVQARILMDTFWPGPLTLVFQKQRGVPEQVTGGLDTVAVRMPSHPIAQALIAASHVPVAAPSANRSGRPSPTLAQHVIRDLEGRVEMIIDGGPAEVGIESTVVDLSTGEPVLLRPGGISIEELQETLGMTVSMDAGVASRIDESAEEYKPRSPGMKYRHYSPEAELLIIEGESEQVRVQLIELIHMSGKKLGLLATREMVESLASELAPVSVKVLGKRADINEMAASLFRLLREFDEEDVELILAEGLPLHGLGLAVMNRLRKAAGYQIIQV